MVYFFSSKTFCRFNRFLPSSNLQSSRKHSGSQWRWPCLSENLPSKHFFCHLRFLHIPPCHHELKLLLPRYPVTHIEWAAPWHQKALNRHRRHFYHIALWSIPVAFWQLLANASAGSLQLRGGKLDHSFMDMTRAGLSKLLFFFSVRSNSCIR